MGKASKQAILAAFERLVARYGLDKVSMKDLAKEAGISVGAIYLHFANKDALIVAVEEKWRSHVAIRNETIIQSGLTPEEKLHDIIVEHVIAFSKIIRENQAAFELLMGAMQLRYIGRTVADTRREIFDLMTESSAAALEEGRRLGIFEVDDADQTAQLLVDAFADYFSAPEVVKKKHAEVAKRAEGMFELLMRSIRKK
jgi:AcrR family transcriptional regulator